jgi:hypothetical protein
MRIGFGLVSEPAKQWASGPMKSFKAYCMIMGCLRYDAGSISFFFTGIGLWIACNQNL